VTSNGTFHGSYTFWGFHNSYLQHSFHSQTRFIYQTALVTSSSDDNSYIQFKIDNVPCLSSPSQLMAIPSFWRSSLNPQLPSFFAPTFNLPADTMISIFKINLEPKSICPRPVLWSRPKSWPSLLDYCYSVLIGIPFTLASHLQSSQSQSDSPDT
jgi:hypothetical protein